MIFEALLFIAFACCFCFVLTLYTWLLISFALADVTNDAVFLAFAFKTFDSTFKTFVLVYSDS